MRAQQPLEGDGDGVVVRACPHRQPAGRLGEVGVGARPVGAGRLAQRGQVGDPAVGGLRGADRDQRGARPHGVGQRLQRRGPHLEVAARVERVQDGGEVVVGGEDFGARRQGRGDQRGEQGDGRPGRDPFGGHAGQPGVGGAAHLDVGEQRVERAPFRAQPDSRVERGDGPGGQQGAARGVQVGVLRGELGTDEALEGLHGTTLRPRRAPSIAHVCAVPLRNAYTFPPTCGFVPTRSAPACRPGPAPRTRPGRMPRRPCPRRRG